MKIYDQILIGYRSHRLGLSREDNWHKLWPLSVEYRSWNDGWDLADKDKRNFTKE